MARVSSSLAIRPRLPARPPGLGGVARHTLKSSGCASGLPGSCRPGLGAGRQQQRQGQQGQGAAHAGLNARWAGGPRRGPGRGAQAGGGQHTASTRLRSSRVISMRRLRCRPRRVVGRHRRVLAAALGDQALGSKPPAPAGSAPPGWRGGGQLPVAGEAAPRPGARCRCAHHADDLVALGQRWAPFSARPCRRPSGRPCPSRTGSCRHVHGQHVLVLGDLRWPSLTPSSGRQQRVILAACRPPAFAGPACRARPRSAPQRVLWEPGRSGCCSWPFGWSTGRSWLQLVVRPAGCPSSARARSSPGSACSYRRSAGRCLLAVPKSDCRPRASLWISSSWLCRSSVRC